MRSIFSLLLSFFVTVNLYSQDCKKMHAEQFFRNIKLGENIPGGLVDCAGNVKLEYSFYINYRINYDSLSKKYRKKYAELFRFQSVPFSYSVISTDKKNKIIGIELYYFLEHEHKDEPVVSKPPDNFFKIYNSLVSLYGKPTRTEEPTDRDSLLIKELGISRLVVWECNDIDLQLRVNYGSRNKELNVIDIQIRKELVQEIVHL